VAASTQGSVWLYEYFDADIILELSMTTLKKLLCSLTLLELEPIIEMHLYG
jgi:hypothetical protein